MDVLRNFDWDGLELSSVEPMDLVGWPSNRADLTGLVLENRKNAEAHQAIGLGVGCESTPGDFHRTSTFAGYPEVVVPILAHVENGEIAQSIRRSVGPKRPDGRCFQVG